MQKILEDIYAIDSELRNFEKELVEAINVLLASKPNIKFDEKFIKQLRKEIMAKARDMKAEEGEAAKPIWIFAPFAKNFSYVAIFVLALAVIQVLVFYGLNNKDNSQATVKNGENKKIALSQFVPLQEGAFGRLSGQAPSDGSASAMPRSSAGGGYGGLGGGGGVAGDSEAKMIAPMPYYNYRYVYNGELKLDQDKMEVFKRIKELKSIPGSESILKEAGLGMVDLSTFENPRMQNVSFAEDKDYGLTFFVSFEEGMIGINENWSKWHHEIPATRLNMEDMPADSEVIAMADEFLKAHGVNMGSYGPGYVMGDWRVEYERSINKYDFYIPESLTVVYPVKIKDSFVYNEGGEKDGLYVNVNIKAKKANGLWGLNSNRYETSSYAIETDQKRILSVVERGGIYGYLDPNAKTADVELGEPTLAYMKSWVYNGGISGEELIVPALVFPIKKAPEGQMYFRKNVIVPIVKDILEKGEQNRGGGPVMMEGAVK